MRLPFYCIKREIYPGMVASFNDEEVANVDFQKDLDYYIRVGYLEYADETTKDIVFSSVPPVVSVVLPKGVSSPQSGTVVLPKGVSQDDDVGHVVLKGQMPGQGKVESVDQYMQDQVKKASDMIQDSVKTLEENKPVKKEEKPLPADLVEWFQLRHAQKKSQIARMIDIAKLKYIADYDDKSKKLIDQRLKEIQ